VSELTHCGSLTEDKYGKLFTGDLFRDVGLSCVKNIANLLNADGENDAKSKCGIVFPFSLNLTFLSRLLSIQHHPSNLLKMFSNLLDFKPCFRFSILPFASRNDDIYKYVLSERSLKIRPFKFRREQPTQQYFLLLFSKG